MREDIGVTGKRASLRTGFGILLALMVVSTFTAYRIQESFSELTLAIHRRYVQQQELLTSMRRVLWMAGTTARDFFLNSQPDRVQVLRKQMGALESERDRLFLDLERVRGTDHHTTQLKVRFIDLWDAVGVLSVASPEDRDRYDFVQREIVPRREAAGQLLRELETANHQALYESEAALASTRHGAANRLVFMLGASLLVGVLVVWFSLRYADNLEQQTVRQFAEMVEAKRELERLSARLMEIQEEERTRLSRELHDEIVQTLAVLKIEVTQAQSVALRNPAEAQERLARAKELAERTIMTVRNIMLLLRPSMLDDLGLGPALQWLVEDFSRRTKIPCDFNENGLQDDLPDSVKTCVYRVVQEALHNCQKHAEARRVRVDVVQTSSELSVQVSDDGKGFVAVPREAIPGRKFGVLGMRERAASLNGSLNLISRSGLGTRVCLEIPLVAARDKQSALEAHAS